MPTDIKKVVDGFPHQNISPIIGSPIIGVPTYESINALNLQLNANAASVQSNLDDGLLGLLYLTITPAKYNALAASECFPPEPPALLRECPTPPPTVKSLPSSANTRPTPTFLKSTSPPTKLSNNKS
jgi:hypothetical protein